MSEFILTNCKVEKKPKDPNDISDLQYEKLFVEVEFISSGNTSNFSALDINQEIMRRLQTLTNNKE